MPRLSARSSGTSNFPAARLGNARQRGEPRRRQQSWRGGCARCGQSARLCGRSPARTAISGATAFRCIVESVKQKFTLFSPEGVPLRATLTVTLREYKTLDEQLAHLNLTSPDRTHSHVIQSGDTLSGIAARFYQRPGDWRFIADANGIEDPRRLTVGAF